VCQASESSEKTFHRYQYGGMKAGDAKRRKELAEEKGRLKKVAVDLTGSPRKSPLAETRRLWTQKRAARHPADRNPWT
jgi:hypothetical protein